MPETLDDAKLEIERQKLEIERQKLRLDTTKAKWATFSIGVPIVVVAATIVWGVVSSQTQARQALRLEAMRTIMSTDIRDMQVARASFMREFFKIDLGEDFFKDLGKFTNPEQANVIAKVRFIETVASRGLNPEETARLFNILFEKDWWASDPKILEVLSAASKRLTEK